ncbi:MAG TPA: hypothetical protein VKQ72_03765, partial [Aggregatilineales bacterium]|nr:hypothetical protein [Aggregatilineales bacterium]
RGVLTIVPHFCLVPQEVRAQVPSAAEMVFIKPPLFPDDQINARIYAQNYGIAILPQIPCTPEMLVPPAPQVPGVLAQIMSPHAFDTVTKTVQVVGSVNWPAGSANFFKVEIEGPQFPAWTTVGTTHNNPVDNGLLEQFGAEGLQPGVYKLRITIIGKDGGIMATSPEIPVTVTGQ